MFSSKKYTLFFTPFLIPLAFLLSSCSERSEYGDASDYKKYGYDSRPTVSSVSPTDNSTGVAFSTTVEVTFSKKMSTGTITTNTSDTTCSGSFQLSSDNFTTCVKMSAVPSASNDDKTFTSTPADNLSEATTYKLQITTSVKDTAGNTLASTYTTNGFTTGDITRPTVSSVSPTDNSIYNSVATTVAVTFSEKMATGSVTTNTSDTTCSGSFQLSSDNFTTCIKMSAAPSASNDDKTFTATPADNLSGVTIFKLQITTSVTDTSSNSLANAYISDGFTTAPAGSGTIKGSIIKQSDSSALSGVSVSYAISGTTFANTTSDSSGDYSQSSLSTGNYTLSYSNSGYLDETQSATLATVNQTVTVTTLKMLSDSCASTGTISGNITDAVSSANVDGVSISVRRGLNNTSGTIVKTDTTSSGAYSLSSMERGWYTAQTSKSGYLDSTFHVYSCGNVSSQDSSISTTLSSGAMRIVLSWPTGSTATDLDSHLKIPDNASGSFHIYYDNNKTFYYATNTNTCSSCSSSQLSDNVTLDRDEQSAPGTETTSITSVRSGTYRYSVHDYTNMAISSISKLANSGASVKVYYNSTTTTYNVPNSAGTLWTVFTFTTSGGLVEVGTMSYQTTPADVY